MVILVFVHRSDVTRYNIKIISVYVNRKGEASKSVLTLLNNCSTTRRWPQLQAETCRSERNE